LTYGFYKIITKRMYRYERFYNENYEDTQDQFTNCLYLGMLLLLILIPILIAPLYKKWFAAPEK
jgi:hypothetical protein